MDGQIAGSVGALIGSGPGRGMALMFVILGFLALGLVVFSWLNPSIRLLEDQVPDAEISGPQSTATG